MRYLSLTIIALLALVTVTGCGSENSEHAVVDSGTYEGVIQEVNTEEDEIYVDLGESGVIELYFIEETSLTRNGKTVPFDELETDQSVEVEVERVGKRLDPISVRILE
jgi:CspA family cold shock protein